MTEEEIKRLMAEQNAILAKVNQARAQAAETQRLINNLPRQQYACIVAVDQCGKFSKDGQIPWNYPEDFKWFQAKTKGHICVMGRTTYDDINERLGDRAIESVLPNRKCFVLTSSELPRSNAIAISSLQELDQHLSFEDVDKIVFFCGGERVYREGITKSNTLFITVVNRDVDGDRTFPIEYTQNYFDIDKVFENESAPDLKFTVWKRKP